MPFVDISCACGYAEEDAIVPDALNITCPGCAESVQSSVYATAGFSGILFTVEESAQLKTTFTSNSQKAQWLKTNKVRVMEDNETSRQTYRANEAADWQARRNGYRSSGAEGEARLSGTFAQRQGRLSVSENGPVTQRRHADFISKSKALKKETVERLSNLPQFR